MMKGNEHMKRIMLCALGLLICFAQYTWARPPSPTPTPTPPCPAPTPFSTPSAPVDLNIVAHQDDDILFMNPDILNDVVAGHSQVTVYITAGNVDEDDWSYAMEREEGAIAGYQKLLQLAGTIRDTPHHFDDFTETFQGDSRYPAGCDSDPAGCPLTPTPTPNPHCFACAPHANE